VSAPWAATGTSETPKKKKRLTPWQRYDKIPLAILMSELTDGEVRVFAYLDAIQGTIGRPAKGVNACAAAIHQSPTSFLDNVRTLEEVGLVRQIPHTTEWGGHGMTEFEVICNPARDRGRSSDVRLPVNTGHGETPRGGRKCKAKNPAERKTLSTFRAGGTPAVKTPATQNRPAERGIPATHTGVRTTPSARVLGATKFGVSDEFPAFDDVAGLGRSQVVREVIRGEEWVGGSDVSTAFDLDSDLEESEAEFARAGMLCRDCGKPMTGKSFGDNCYCPF
jgi:hypothetical protein